MIKIFLSLTLLCIPLLLYYFNQNYTFTNGRIIFTIIVILVMVQRIWETFFTFKDKNRLKYKGDWTLIITLFTYLFSGILMICEYFLIPRNRDIYIIVIGVILFILSYYLRYLSIKLLKEQWTIHAIGKAKERNIKLELIKVGPYKYTRHPIYFATIIELLSLALIFNTFYTIFFIIIGISSYIIRAKYEEKTLIDIFGDEYLNYKNYVPFLFPSKFFKIK